MTKSNESNQPESEHRGSGSALNCFVMFLLRYLWKAIKWLAPRLAVTLAIGFGVTWGGLFQEDFGWIKVITSWLVIWASIGYYRWHLNTYET